MAWFDDEHFWRDNYDVLFSEDTFGRAAADVDRVLALANGHPDRALDAAQRYRFSHRLYSGFELRTAMEATGFSVSLFGDLGGNPYDASALRLVAVGRKP